ncbi:MAG: NEW3 domain-containing protein [Anaerolineales bacterium]|nr:NEW3 domain-containing protein [Anaerolineales bacterium]
MKRIALALLAVTALFTMAQAEAEGLVLSTPFPSQVVSSGESLNISIEVRNPTQEAQIAELSVAESPEGWQAILFGGGRAVRSVYVGAGESRSVSLQVEVPDDASEGTYDLEVTAESDSGEAALPLELVVGQVVPAQLEMSVELPILRGSPTSSFDFQAEVTNDSGQDMLVNFEADAPENFQVTFSRQFGGEEVTSLPVSAGSSESVQVSVNPPDRAAAGEYPVSVRAVGEGVEAQLELTAVVTGQPRLSVSGPDGRLSGNVTSGETTALTLVVANQGSAAASNIELSASAPSQWNVEFDPEVIDELPADQQIEVTANITPADNAVAGDYQMAVRARPEEGSTTSADFRLTLETSTQWGIVGLVLIAAALAVVALAVSRFGRR